MRWSRRRRCCWKPLRLLGPLLLQLVLFPSPGTTAGRSRCDTIYKGFAECLISLGDSMAQGDQPEGLSPTQPELDAICRWELSLSLFSLLHLLPILACLSPTALPLLLCLCYPGPACSSLSPHSSWDNFHACAIGVLASCPEEAAAIWESLRQESRKVQYQGNLHDLCSARAQLPSSVRGVAGDETNQETLRAMASTSSPASILLAAALALAWIMGPLA
uniref:Neuritin 1 like n=1 Tax=Ornithorhynchus anatinus TaxID=9258 RepID=A0A6I8NYI9_ORNAN